MEILNGNKQYRKSLMSNTPQSTVCPVCGRKFPCGELAGRLVCWCYFFPVVHVRQLQDKNIITCVCPVCLRDIAVKQGYAENLIPEICFTETTWEFNGKP